MKINKVKIVKRVSRKAFSGKKMVVKAHKSKKAYTRKVKHKGENK